MTAAVARTYHFSDNHGQVQGAQLQGHLDKHGTRGVALLLVAVLQGRANCMHYLHRATEKQTHGESRGE